jgi:predicted amidohydrolase YtcJ
MVFREILTARTPRIVLRRAWSLLFLVHCVCTTQASAQANHADLILRHAHIVTMTANPSPAQAVAIRGDRILWVGTDEDASKKFTASRVIDLRGATLLPGLIDAHTHLLNLGQSLLRLNLKDTAAPEEVVARVKQKVAASAAGEWIQGWGWDEGKWASHYPTNVGLSAVSPHNPVYLVGLHSFAAWANQRALQIAGITKDTPDPVNGKIVRDEKTGEPTGILLNHAQELVTKKIPPLTLDQAKKALEVGAREGLRNGLTSLHEAQVSPLMIEAYRALLRENRMPLRIYVMLDGADKPLVEEWLNRGPEIDPRHQFTIRAFKLFADGALGSRGASLLEPYSDAPQTKGVVTTPESAIYDLTRRALDRGFQVCTHAIGDAANRSTLDAYERAFHDRQDARPLFLYRLRIEHAQVLAPADIPRFAKLGIIASMQPVHATSDMPWAEKRVGPERIKGAYAWRSVLDTGAHVPFSSDFPGETLNPFYGIYAAVTRQDPQGNPAGGWHPEQRATLAEALRGYTTEAAYAEFEESAKGSIEPGKLADFTVIDKDLTTISPKEIVSISVLRTFVGGKSVFEARPE